MEKKIINCYELDIKQNFPEDLRLSQIECESLKQRNNILFNSLIVLGTGLLAIYIFKILSEKKEDKNKYSS